jgi:hypothetical protein
MADTTPSEAPARPVLRLVRGAADAAEIAEELAALVAVLAARSGGGEDTPAARSVSGWAERSRAVRVPLHAAPGGWKRSGLPR